MKMRTRKYSTTTIPTSRWLAYAGAAAATSLTVTSPAEAEIHYSGRVDTVFGTFESKSVAFPLEQPGNSIIFARTRIGSSVDFFGAKGLRSGAFMGAYPVFSYAYVWRIKEKNQDKYLSGLPFTNGAFGFGTSGTMIRGDRSSLNWRWHGKGTDFVAFRFDNGSGKQYGWARVHMDGPASNFSFTVFDYAWADPGEPIKAGQISSESRPDGLAEGSLGFLALGGAGLFAWRKTRAKTDLLRS